MATANAIRPRSSAAAKPMYRRPCWLSEAAGLRSALCRNEPNTYPTPSRSGADADGRETGTDNLCGSEIHD